jgi:hypothetical protein
LKGIIRWQYAWSRRLEKVQYHCMLRCTDVPFHMHQPPGVMYLELAGMDQSFGGSGMPTSSS